MLIALQNEYCAWLDNLPENLEGSRLAVSARRGRRLGVVYDVSLAGV
jgi:hypothetical protein